MEFRAFRSRLLPLRHPVADAGLGEDVRKMYDGSSGSSPSLRRSLLTMFRTGPESSPLSGPQTRCSRRWWVSARPELADSSTGIRYSMTVSATGPPPRIVPEGDDPVAGAGEGAGAVHHVLEHRPEVQAFADAQAGLAEPGQLLSQGVVFSGRLTGIPHPLYLRSGTEFRRFPGPSGRAG